MMGRVRQGWLWGSGEHPLRGKGEKDGVKKCGREDWKGGPHLEYK